MQSGLMNAVRQWDFISVVIRIYPVNTPHYWQKKGLACASPLSKVKLVKMKITVGVEQPPDLQWEDV
jgi:hypothetical protein